MKNPIAVLTSDVHYNLQTRGVAWHALTTVIHAANNLSVPLIVAGDLHDTKANLRGECVNDLLYVFSKCQTPCYILVGNHDLINEKAHANSINFLAPINGVVLVKDFKYVPDINVFFMPYQSNVRTFLQQLPPRDLNSVIIAHQGLLGSDSGEYIQDHSALAKVELLGRRVISGHYHRRQTIELPEEGKFDYIGNPFTLGFGEAEHPQKGYQILYSDYSLGFVPIDLPKHIIIDTEKLEPHVAPNWQPNDYLWVKVRGESDYLSTVTKEKIAKEFGIEQDFRLELIADNKDTEGKSSRALPKKQSLDDLIDGLQSPSERKERLKNKWKRLIE